MIAGAAPETKNGDRLPGQKQSIPYATDKAADMKKSNRGRSIINDLRESRDPYQLAHDNVRAARGRASGYRCVDTTDARDDTSVILLPHRAGEWSLKPLDECAGNLGVWVHQGYPMWFSDCIDDYTPRCREHHRQADLGKGNARVNGHSPWYVRRPDEEEPITPHVLDYYEIRAVGA